MIYSDEIKFCVDYLKKAGMDAAEIEEVMALSQDLDLHFDLVRSQKDKFEELATKLRELWPPGSKDGMYEWRGTIPELTKRLQFIWEDRFPSKQVNIDECLEVARRYLARYEQDSRFMQTLKYFIFKRKEIGTKKDGRIRYVFESKFADMLEGKNDEDAIQNEWDSLINDANIGQGELV